MAKKVVAHTVLVLNRFGFAYRGKLERETRHYVCVKRPQGFRGDKAPDSCLVELGDARDANSLQERIDQLFEQHKQLQLDLAKALEDKKFVEKEWDMLAVELDKINGDNRGLKYERDTERASRVQAETTARRLEKQLGAIHHLAHLPETLEDVVVLIEQLHADRIVFLEEAKASARSALINWAKNEIWKMWECLWQIATTLHDLHFTNGQQSSDMEKVFYHRTGFKLALTEGGQTKADKQLMKQRRRVYEGREIDITPHVKYGSKPRILRVHYYADPKSKRLIIGHCGDHMDTAGTRRQ